MMADRGALESASGPFRLGGVEVEPGASATIELRVARLHDFTEQMMRVRVVRGRKPGPSLLLTAAVHGDEINGVEVVRRVLSSRVLRRLCGTLIAVPIVNVFGFNSRTRYLPDRRDLNRCFPGSPGGSLAASMAHMVGSELLSRSTHAIDLHTGAIHRANLPQLRASVDDPETLRLAKAFGVPVVINAETRDGSLREAARERGITMLLFEGGEALRFDEAVIQSAQRGIRRVMRAIGMLPPRSGKDGLPVPRLKPPRVFVARSSYWLRAPQSGIVTAHVGLGARVAEGQRLATIGDAFGEHAAELVARHAGIVVGMSRLPLASRGDALFHVATFEDLDLVHDLVEGFDESIASQLE